MPRKFKNEPPPLDLGQETIGERIAQLRKNRGYTQMELGERIGITNNLVSEYEIGRLKVSGEMIARFALALEVTADEIIGLKTGNASNPKPSFRISRRLNRIERLPISKQKALLQIIDGFLRGEEK